MKKSIGMVAVILATCVPIGLAGGTAAYKKTGGGQSAQASTSATKNAPVALTREAQDLLWAEDAMRYRGTEIGPRPEVDDDEFELHTQISQSFALQDPAPSPDRLAHFAWLIRPDIRVNGWYGTIDEVVQDGGLTLVRVKIRPRLASAGATITSTTAYYVETYIMTDSGLQFLGGEAPKETLTVLMTD